MWQWHTMTGHLLDGMCFPLLEVAVSERGESSSKGQSACVDTVAHEGPLNTDAAPAPGKQGAVRCRKEKTQRGRDWTKPQPDLASTPQAKALSTTAGKVCFCPLAMKAATQP